MTSERQTGIPRRGGDEQDALSPRARKIHTVFGRPGAAKAAKRSFNRRVRRAGNADAAGSGSEATVAPQVEGASPRADLK
jgi:hypothetical protein